jgi:murein DD-endopeptidase MepM/ murein hydrolase activator NlpD
MLPAFGFDYARYQAADLDQLLAQRRPRSGIDLYPALPLKLTASIIAYGEPCPTGLLARTMLAAGIPQDWINGVKVTRCIKVRSAKGRELRLFMQDEVASFLPKEAPLGSTVTLFAIQLFTDSRGPGLLVNEFSTGEPTNDDQAKSAAARAPACGCGTADYHPGMDITNGVAGSPVTVTDAGVVVKAEPDENASVDALGIGRCGRYVVVKHSYPNGKELYTRYAQLGRVVGNDGEPLATGMRVKRDDKIGEIGDSKILHFEMRPVDPATMDTSTEWTARYGSDPTMEWSRYQAVDPQTFDLDGFGGGPAK